MFSKLNVVSNDKICFPNRHKELRFHNNNECALFYRCGFFSARFKRGPVAKSAKTLSLGQR